MSPLSSMKPKESYRHCYNKMMMMHNKKCYALLALLLVAGYGSTIGTLRLLWIAKPVGRGDDGLTKNNQPISPSAVTALGSSGSSESLKQRILTSSSKEGRFPVYGTVEFDRQCRWAIESRPVTGNCTILARLPPQYKEGVSAWTGQVVSGFILSKQAGCRFLLDYGPEIMIQNVLFPNQHLDWRVPPEFDCSNDPRCFLASTRYLEAPEGLTFQDYNFTAIPSYRNAFQIDQTFISKMNFRSLSQALPGFELETGMACSLGSLFRLAPNASMYQPDLFSRILPALNAPDVLVLSLYIRTGKAEQIGGKWKDNERKYNTYRIRAKQTSSCALVAEQQELAKRSYSKVVWMVVSDSSFVKDFIQESYTREYTVSNETGIGFSREIITTQSRGAHTKTSRLPSTADFAEAFIDWYLIGESDAAVSDTMSPSFGDTAAMRTTRPYYKLHFGALPQICQKVEPALK